MRIDAADPTHGLGFQQTRCQIEIAFQRRYYEPREEDQDPNQGPPPERPEEPGQCVFHSRERPQGDRASHSQPDNWFISGDLSGPEVLYLHSLEQTIELEMVRAEDGMIRYELKRLQAGDFPIWRSL